MDSSLLTSRAAAASVQSHEVAQPIRVAERVAIAYFLFTAVSLSLRGGIEAPLLAYSWSIPVFIWTLALAETRFSKRWSNYVRDWLPQGLILVAYWQLEWFSAHSGHRWQNVWILWDRTLLDGFGLRAAIEFLGPVIPAILEAVYLSLYAVPVLGMTAIYLAGQRRHADRFLTTLLFGTLLTYALIPFFPTISPRHAFPTEDLPNYLSIWRVINTWVLDHADITTGVFPSGHVAVAFSAAFGMLRVLPAARRRLAYSFFGIATIVFLATIYARYHYAADGLASIAIAAFAWRITAWRDEA